MIIELTSEASLNTCPLCGSQPVLRTDGLSKVGASQPVPHFWVKCTDKNCAISPSSKNSEQEAVAAWNQRP